MNAYWIERGKTYEAEYAGRIGAEDKALLTLLRSLRYDFVLDAGCGFGRVGEMIAYARPDARYTGIDISPDLLDAARQRLPKAALWQKDVTAFETSRRWDLVLAISVLSHIPPDQVAGVAHKLRTWARHDLVTVDWVGPGSSDYQWVHDYGALFPDAQVTRLGAVSMFHVALP